MNRGLIRGAWCCHPAPLCFLLLILGTGSCPWTTTRTASDACEAVCVPVCRWRLQTGCRSSRTPMTLVRLQQRPLRALNQTHIGENILVTLTGDVISLMVWALIM